MSADPIEALELENPRAAGLLLLAAIQASGALSGALRATRAVTSPEEHALVSQAIGHVLGQELQDLINRIISLHPLFDVETIDEMDERLWSVGIDPGQAPSPA